MRWPDPRTMARLIKVIAWAHEYMDGERDALKRSINHIAEQVLLEFPDFMSVASPKLIAAIETEWGVETDYYHPDGSSFSATSFQRLFSKEEAEGLVRADLEAHPPKEGGQNRNPRVVYRMATKWMRDEDDPVEVDYGYGE